MVKLSASIRSKADWWEKYKVPEIRAKWREEALNTKMAWIERATMLVPLGEAPQHFAAGSRYPEESTVQLTEQEVDYVLDELEGYAKQREDETGIQARKKIALSETPGHNIVISRIGFLLRRHLALR